MRWLDMKDHANKQDTQMTWEQRKQESISILDKYKEEISKEAYDRLLWVIGTQAIESIFPDERDIKDMIRVEKGEITTDKLVEEIKQRYQKEWGCGVMFTWLNPKPKMSDFNKQLLSSNIVRAETFSQLSDIERSITTVKTQELKINPAQGNLDYKHLKDINRYLLQDIYVWAGKDRYDIGIRGGFKKGNTYFTSGNKLPEVSKALFNALKKENHFKNLSKDDFIKSTASFMNSLNILHPFREGNGRTQRIFIEQLAENARYALDLSKVSSGITIQASIQAEKGNLKGFEIILGNNIKERAKQ